MDKNKVVDSDKDGFKKGGKKRAAGGAVHGSKSAVRLDKHARGGATGSPYSSAKGGEMPSKNNSGKGSGHEDERPESFVP